MARPKKCLVEQVVLHTLQDSVRLEQCALTDKDGIWIDISKISDRKKICY